MFAFAVKRSVRSGALWQTPRRFYSEDILKMLGVGRKQKDGKPVDFMEVLKKGTNNTERKKQVANRSPKSNLRQGGQKGAGNRGKPFKSSAGNTPQKQRQRVVIPSVERLTSDAYNPETFKWTTSSDDLENQYMTSVVKDIHGINPGFQVVSHDGSGLSHQSLRQFIKSLKEEQLFDIINVQEVNGGKVPFLKTIDKKVCLKNYTEKLAEEKSKLYGRTMEKKREASVKFIKVSWEISEHDLRNQKRNEIEGMLKTGQKIVLLIDTRQKLGNRNLSFEIEKVNEGDETRPEPKLNELESLRRGKILDYIKLLFQEQADVEIEGSLNKRILMTVKPHPVKLEEPKQKKVKQDSKKLERQAKQKQREEEKRLKLEEKKRQFEELLAKNNIAS